MKKIREKVVLQSGDKWVDIIIYSFFFVKLLKLASIVGDRHKFWTTALTNQDQDSIQEKLDKRAKVIGLMKIKNIHSFETLKKYK